MSKSSIKVIGCVSSKQNSVEKSGKAGKDKLKKEPSIPILTMPQISSTHSRLINQPNNECRVRHVPGKIFSMNRVILFFLATLILFSCSPAPTAVTPVSVKTGRVVHSDLQAMSIPLFNIFTRTVRYFYTLAHNCIFIFLDINSVWIRHGT